MVESEEELKNFLMRVKEESAKNGLKLNIKKTKIMATGRMRREDSLEKTLMLGKCEGKRRRGRQRTRWLDSVIEATNMNLIHWKTGGPGVLWSMGSRRVGHDLTTKQQQFTTYYQISAKKFKVLKNSSPTTKGCKASASDNKY